MPVLLLLLSQSHAGQDSQCLLGKNTPPQANITSYVSLTTNSGTALLNAIATTGPVAISVEARYWSKYESGVFNGCNQTK
jgi:hypothetical protein